MSTTTEFNYNYVFDLAVQLSPEEQKRLVRELPNGTAPKSSEKFESFLPDPNEEEEPYDHADASQREFWKDFLRRAVRLPFDERTAEIAADIFQKLRQKNIRLESYDVFIAATAIANDLSIATLNRKYFEHIDGLKLIAPN